MEEAKEQEVLRDFEEVARAARELLEAISALGASTGDETSTLVRIEAVDDLVEAIGLDLQDEWITEDEVDDVVWNLYRARPIKRE